MRRALLAAVLASAGFGLAQIAASAPPASFCVRHPSHPRCQTVPTTTQPPTTTVTVPPTTTVEPPPTTTNPVPTDTERANVWIAPTT